MRPNRKFGKCDGSGAQDPWVLVGPGDYEIAVRLANAMRAVDREQ